MLMTVSCGDKPDVYSISLPNLKASADESVVAFDLHVNAGSVQSVSNIPLGWQVKIENDANWVSRIRANSTAGAASLAPDELKRLAFNVRHTESETFKFDVSGVVSLTKTFEARKLDVKLADFNLASGQ